MKPAAPGDTQPLRTAQPPLRLLRWQARTQVFHEELEGGARLGSLLLPWQRTVEVLTPKPAAGAGVLAQVITEGQRLEAGLEFAGLRIDLVEIW